MLENKLFNLSKRSFLLIGMINPKEWAVLSDIHDTLFIAADTASILEKGKSASKKLAPQLEDVMMKIRAMAGNVTDEEYSLIQPIARELEDYLPLAKQLDQGPLVLVERNEQPQDAA